VAGELHNQALSPLCAPAAEHLAPAGRSHSHAKTMRPLAAPVVGLVSPLQITPPDRIGGIIPPPSTDGEHSPQTPVLSRSHRKTMAVWPFPGPPGAPSYARGGQWRAITCSKDVTNCKTMRCEISASSPKSRCRPGSRMLGCRRLGGRRWVFITRPDLVVRGILHRGIVRWGHGSGVDSVDNS
jgi:hypothetical protein